jgi:hypothetical protein
MIAMGIGDPEVNLINELHGEEIAGSTHARSVGALFNANMQKSLIPFNANQAKRAAAAIHCPNRSALLSHTRDAQDAPLDIAERSDERIANEGREGQVPSIASLIGGAEFKEQSSQRRVAQWTRRVLSRILADTLFCFLRKP